MLPERFTSFFASADGGPLGTCIDQRDAKFMRFDPEFRFVSSCERIHLLCLKNKCFPCISEFFKTQFYLENTVNMKNEFHALVLKYLDAVIHEEMVWD
jgi:hypothetical protein